MGCTEGEATMERLVPISLVALLLAFVTTLPNKDDWDIYSFHINSTVASRYATTVITSRVANRMEQSKEIEFHVRIPKNAFISKFRMFIDGQVYDGAVKAKEQAQQQYDRAVSRGQSAGLVSSVGRTMEEFKTSVTVAAHRKVTFELTYEELLKRRLGKYELQIHARPMQPVKDFKVDVHVHEKAGINFIEVKGGLSTNALGDAITKTQTDKEAWVHFYPTEDQQKTCDSCGEQGLNGDLVLVYDVNRDNEFGDIKNSGGYFVHHFAPSKLARIPKNVVFVIDQSGSMHGKKIQQTRTALIHILTDLAEDDFFGLITFSGTIFYWKRELIQATKANVNSAKGFAQNIPASGGTNINEAVIQGTKMLNEFPREGSASILILLTDGDPTTGVTNPEQIQSNVRQAIADRFPLYCLGFGFDVNFEFLEKMSLENNGAARRIYEDSDADLQLKGFYEEVATPLLTNVTLTYAGGTNLTQTHFRQYYNGSEIVVAGEITDNNIGTFTPEVVAISVSGRMKFLETNDTVEPPGSDSRVQRVWAYLTVKQLLEKELLVSGAEKDKLKKEALDLSLKYSFVTPLTSMVVTKPQGEGPDVLHKPTEGAKPTVPPSFGTVQHYLRGGAGHASRLLKTSHDSHILQSGVSYGHYAVGAFPEAGAVQHSPGGYLPPPLSAYDDYHHYHDLIFPTGSIVRMDPPIVSVTKSTAPVSHRFLLKSSTQPLPLCFDVPGDTRLKLLHHPNRELSVNGILDSGANRGFKKIGIHIQKDQFIEMYPSGIVVKKAQDVVYKSARDLATAEITVIGRDNEFEVTSGDIRMIVLIHLKDGEKFLWPVLQQKPSNVSLEGILALQPAVYDEVQQTPSVKLQIKDQVIDVTRSTAVDYSVSVPPTVECWLVSPESALQGPLDDFTVAEL